MKLFNIFGGSTTNMRRLQVSGGGGGGGAKTRSRSHTAHAKREPTQIANAPSWQDEYERRVRQLQPPSPPTGQTRPRTRHRSSSHSYHHQHLPPPLQHQHSHHSRDHDGEAASSNSSASSRRRMTTTSRPARYVPSSRRLLTVGTDNIAKIGADIDLTEAETLKYIAEHTTIPVPKIMSSYEEGGYAYIMMERIDGQTLSDAWPTLSSWTKAAVISDLRSYISQLRRLRPSWTTRIGSTAGGPAVDLRYRGEIRGGPFQSEDGFNRWQLSQLRDGASAFTRDKYAALHKTNHRLVFTHGDFNFDNVIVNNGEVVAILNWEFAGWYPEHWDFCKTAQHMAYSEEFYPVLKELYETQYLEEYAVQELLDKEVRHGGY